MPQCLKSFRWCWPEDQKTRTSVLIVMKVGMQRLWDLLSISLLFVQRSRMAKNASKVSGGVGLKSNNENECTDCYENQYATPLGPSEHFFTSCPML